ncbi:MAG: hypothetical protein R3192_04545 [Woeseiaceae bacterium]|nr:hypothetical protein [Woeseiaceae bacterium]
MTPDPPLDELVEAFENATLEAGGFDHEAHIRVAWHYLEELGLLGALERFTAAIKRLTQTLGVASRYHETITWFYLIAIAERLERAERGDWQAFKAANPDLFAREPALVHRYYSQTLLASEAARRRFVLPDLLPVPVTGPV